MGHRLFEIDVLLRVQRGLQARIVLMVGRADDDGIDAALPQQFPVIDVAGGVGRVGTRLFEVRFVNVGNRDALRTQLLKIAAQIASASAGPDDSIRQPVIGAPSGAAASARERAINLRRSCSMKGFLSLRLL